MKSKIILLLVVIMSLSMLLLSCGDDMIEITGGLYTESGVPITLNTKKGAFKISEISDVLFMSADSEEKVVLGSMIGITGDQDIDGITLRISLKGMHSRVEEEYILEDMNVYAGEVNWISFYTGDFENAVLPKDDYMINFSVVE